MADNHDQILILGGGLTGLSAGYDLSKAGRPVALFERDSAVGGISKTIEHRGFRFDLGPHRFFTKDAQVESFVKELMGTELITVPRKTKIFMHGKYFDYPLEPVNAVFGMGIPATLRILGDYGIERVKRLFHKPEPVSLEDWVAANFGRTLFDIYFKEYSEKVWGIDCSRISAEWVATRIRGLSLSKAIGNAFFKQTGGNIPSLVDKFLYPEWGIGRISEKLAEEIRRTGELRTKTGVERIYHSDFSVNGVVVTDSLGSQTLRGAEYVSSIPVTRLVSMLDPLPPPAVMAAAARLKFRDNIIVAVMLNRKRVTDLTWIYLPGREIPIGRIHEPTNWSEKMAPEGKTLLVAEIFSFQEDALWNAPDEQLTAIAINSLERLGYIRPQDVIDSLVVRAPHAYPLFEVGYRGNFDEVYEYLSRFRNLHIAGRVGLFKYYNMDHAIASGLAAARTILQKREDARRNALSPR